MSRRWRSSVRVALVALALLRPRPAAGDDDVVVRGTQASGFVSRARIEDAPREVTDAASLVEPLPGVHVRRLGADDSFATLSIRGSSSTQVAIYLAGVPLSGGADPTLDLATLPLWPGASAVVHRSFAPAALGRGSLGGTLVLDPPSPRATPRTEEWAAVGAYGARRLRIGDVSEAPGGVRVATGFSASRSDDDFSYVDPFKDGDATTVRRNAGHAAVAALASVAIPISTSILGRSAPSGDGALTVTALAQARHQELPGSALSPTPFQSLDSSRLLSVFELTLPAGGGAFGVRGWGRREGLSLHDQAASAPLTPSSTDDAIVAAGASTGWRGRFGAEGDSSVEIRVDGSAERYLPGTWVGVTAPPGAGRTNAGLAADATTRAAIVTLAASGRADAWVDSADDGTSSATAKPTGNVGAELPLGPLTLASHAGFVARPPSFVERYGNRGAFVGDPALKSESAFTADAGARAAERLGGGRVKLRAALDGFSTWANDLITYVYVGQGGRSKATNIGRARIVGFEGELGLEAFGFEARASHTALATANLSSCSFAVGGGPCERPALPGRPTEDFVGDLAYTYGPVRIRYGIDVVAGIFIDQTQTNEVPPRVLHDAGATVQLPQVRGLSLSLDVRNLFDLRAVDYAGVQGPVRAPIGDLYDYPLPGRRLLLSARLSLDHLAPLPPAAAPR